MSLLRRTSVVFLCTLAYLAWLAASRFVFVMNDEGIYLDGALRVFHGQMPYRDFFSITGPGTFALVAASFHLFGVTLFAARIPVVFDIAIITACLFWLTSKLSDSKAAIFAILIYVPFATFVETAVVVNHRWDSAAWAILAGTLIIGASSNPSLKWMGLAAGIAAGIAAWCTPPVALAVLALAACIAAYRATRPLFWMYCSGIALMFAAGVIWIVSTGTLHAMLDSLVWNSSNYVGANRTWYAAVPGGYANLLHGSVLDIAIGLVIVAFFTLPATIPFVSTIWLWKRPSRTVVILLSMGAALVLSAYPRWDLNHLTWVAAPFYVLTAALIARHPSPAMKKIVAGAVVIAASLCSAVIFQQRIRETTQLTTLGRVHGRPGDLAMLGKIQSRVEPSDTLFVFPYRPLLYFVTGAQNPTRYSFLQPGMASDQDQLETVRELRARPPRWVIYAHVSPRDILLTWPSTDPRRLDMPLIESFLRENYRAAERWGDLELLEQAGSHDRGSAHTAVRRTATD